MENDQGRACCPVGTFGSGWRVTTMKSRKLALMLSVKLNHLIGALLEGA
jgi:hypothetical protein